MADIRTVDELLDTARHAADAGDWVAPGLAFVDAAKQGALAVARRVQELADAGRADAAALFAGIVLEYVDESGLPLAVSTRGVKRSCAPGGW
ncbi:hypothetical protein ACWD0A_09840 [Streptomyces sp. NPDC002867]